ncbi:MAG: type II toxin-antitoxin system PemK/MazF family toxin [Cyanophyceae cyanobacterium]
MAKKFGNSEYIPKRGDIVWINFNPVRGHEPAGHRPAFIVSPAPFNKTSSLAFVCPITSKIKGFSFEVVIAGEKIQGAVLVHHLKSIDWRARTVKFVERAPEIVIEEVLAKLETLVL